MPENKFTFEISLTVLDHLGRNLYRSFATILGEAISNAWDADAKNVWIYIDSTKDNFFIKDDGVGMTADDFQNKFLKIGYSKRRDGTTASPSGRVYIGRKGIGKLALLSCADKIAVISKAQGQDYIGGVIDNTELDKAITHDLTPEEYSLDQCNQTIFGDYSKDHNHGTIVYFENVIDGVKNNFEFLKTTIALDFRFSLIDNSFNIFVNNEKITLNHLGDLADNTQFLWNINELRDPFISEKLTKLIEPAKNISMAGNVKGFIASVNKPSNLKIATTEERAGVNLFVNGRLREKDILKHIPTARIAENYFYGQIHCDELDDNEDRFTSSREGIIADDPKYKEFLDNLKKKILEIVSDWDGLRRKHRKDGDPENESISNKDRKAEELFNEVSGEYKLPVESKNREEIESWVDSLKTDATFNLSSYTECFISENLVRKYWHEKNITASVDVQKAIDKWKETEITQKKDGNINIDIRKDNDDLSYLDMGWLTSQADTPGVQNTLQNDVKAYRPIRNAVAHTALITDEAKRKLTAVYENIKGRVKTLLSQ